MKIPHTMSPDEALAMVAEIEDGEVELRHGCLGGADDGSFELDLAPVGGFRLTIERAGLGLTITLSPALLNALVCAGVLVQAERTRRTNELRERNEKRRVA